MGSLTSRPELPQVQQPVIITVPSYSYTPDSSVSTASDTSSSGTETTATDDEIKAQAREQNLLRRARGTVSTVLTGLNGILSQGASSSSSRKTLLGE